MNILKNIERKDKLRDRYRYAVYERKLTHKGAITYSRSFIVLKNQYGVIVHFTNFHKYITTYDDSVYRPIGSDVREKLLYVCDMLNSILIENYDATGAAHVFQISHNMLEVFFRNYALEILPNGNHRSRKSIEKCISFVTMFFWKLCNASSQGINNTLS